MCSIYSMGKNNFTYGIKVIGKRSLVCGRHGEYESGKEAESN